MHRLTGSIATTVVSLLISLFLGVFSGLLPLYMVVLILLLGSPFVIRYLFSSSTNQKVLYRIESNLLPTPINNSELKKALEYYSEAVSKTHNNLDQLLGIATVNYGQLVKLADQLPALLPTDSHLFIDDHNYDWFIIPKDLTTQNSKDLRVVSLHNKNLDKNKIFQLDKSSDKLYTKELDTKELDSILKAYKSKN